VPAGSATPYRVLRSLELPQQQVWGDLCWDPLIPGRILVGLRTRSLGALVLDPGGQWSTLQARSTLSQPRLRAIGADGAWYVTSPQEPHTIWVIEPRSGTVVGVMPFRGRFDPDTRLALRVLPDGDAIVAGCGVPGLQRLNRQGALVHDYYALQELHKADFAWRGVVALAVDPVTGTAMLVVRHLEPGLLVVDPERGAIDKRRGFVEPCWAEFTPGGVQILELESPGIVDTGGLRPLPAVPWHYLRNEQFLADPGSGQVHLVVRRGMRLKLETLG